MSKRQRRNHAPAFEAKVALAAVRGEKTLAELAQLDRSVGLVVSHFVVLCPAAYLAQGDALLIESQANMRLADECEAAQ